MGVRSALRSPATSSRALAEANADPMPVPEAPAATLPRRADVVRVLRAVNDHWIATHPDPGHNRWDRATYFSGDLALHRLVGSGATSATPSAGPSTTGGASTAAP